MALWSVSMPLNQAASMWWPTINEPFCSAWPLGRVAPGTWRLYFCRSLPALLSINTTNGVIFYSEMDICPLTLVTVCLVRCWTYFRECYMAFNLRGKMDRLDKLSHPLSRHSQIEITHRSPEIVFFLLPFRCVWPVAEWLLFAGEWRYHDGERHQSRAGKGRLSLHNSYHYRNEWLMHV